MNNISNKLSSRLESRKEAGLLRSLSDAGGLIDFTSNDYLGFARNEHLRELILAKMSADDGILGSTGSRLLRGNNKRFEDLENTISKFHNADTGLLFNSGFAANTGLIAAVGHECNRIIYDELVHASIHDGMRLCRTPKISFQHNNLNHLEEILRETTGDDIILVESLYSMEGDFAPLTELSELADKYGASLIVDEAHATGIYGEDGKGMVVKNGLENKVFATVVTFGKALGSHGAIVLGGEVLRDYLINFARPFIYSTAKSIHSLMAIEAAYELLPEAEIQRRALSENIKLFIELKGEEFIKEKHSQIQSIIIPGNLEVRNAANEFQKLGFDVRPIVSPTVPAGKERLRICLHSFNTKEEINSLTLSLSAFAAKV